MLKKTITLAVFLASTISFANEKDETAGDAASAAAPPQMAPFGDGTFWVLTKELRYRLGKSQEYIIIPKGFVTDLASVPQTLWSVLPKTGKYMSAAILHDFLYANQSCSKAQADMLLKMEMEFFGVSKVQISSIYYAVRFFGYPSWGSNRDMAERGVTRVMPDFELNQFLETELDSSQSWKAIQQQISFEVPEKNLIVDTKIKDACGTALQGYYTEESNYNVDSRTEYVKVFGRDPVFTYGKTHY